MRINFVYIVSLKGLHMMKKLAALFIVLLPTLGIGAQKNQYVGQLDSIVVRDDNQPEQTRKFEFSYTEKRVLL